LLVNDLAREIETASERFILVEEEIRCRRAGKRHNPV
jgi:hypothetical protein